MGNKKHTLIRPLCFGMLGAAFLATSTMAHAKTQRQQQTEACKGDALKLCALAIPNEEKITKCMEKKKEKLSPKCRAVFDQGLQDKQAAQDKK